MKELTVKLFAFLLLIFLSACTTSNYVSFYIEDGYQYFIKPLEFKAVESEEKEELSIDFTIRILKDSRKVTTNFSSISDMNVGMCKQLYLVSDDRLIEAKNVQDLFFEKDKQFVFRSTSFIEFDELYDFFDSQSAHIEYISNDTIKFYPTSKTKKIIQKVKTDLLDIAKDQKVK